MKIIGYLIGLSLLSSVAIAADPTDSTLTMFIVQRQSGFVAAENSYKVQCQVEAEKTNKVWSKGRDSQIKEENADTVYTEKIPNADAVRAQLRAAAKGTLAYSTGPTDKPTARFYGIIEGPVVDQYVKLLINKSTDIWKNTADETTALLEFADLNCPIP